MGRGGGGGGGFSGGGFSGGGGGGHIGGGFSGGRVGGSHSSGGSSWGGSHHSSGGSSWGGTRNYNSGGSNWGYRPTPRYNSNSGGGLFPPLWWWIWGGGSTRNNSYNQQYRQTNNNNNNNNGGGPQPQKEPEKKEPEKKRSSAVGCLSAILIVVAVILAFILVAGIRSSASAKNRTKLSEKPSVDIGYLDDQLGWIDNKSLVNSSMKSFYDKTGVMPYLVITDDIGGASTDSAAQTYTQNLYAKLFGTDQTHFLVVWYQKNGYDDYAYMYSGTSANGVVDADARDVVMNYFNRYYSSDYDDSHYFAKVFEDSAEEIMLQSDSGWRTTLLLLIAVIGVLVAMNIIDYKNTMKIKKQEAAAKILNAKVDDPGWKDDAEVLSEKYSDEASELASKYEDKN